eukprot:scaffold185932_cov20-Prasinocladus_malaysianus.AAC.1
MARYEYEYEYSCSVAATRISCFVQVWLEDRKEKLRRGTIRGRNDSNKRLVRKGGVPSTAQFHRERDRLHRKRRHGLTDGQPSISWRGRRMSAGGRATTSAGDRMTSTVLLRVLNPSYPQQLRPLWLILLVPGKPGPSGLIQ